MKALSWVAVGAVMAAAVTGVALGGGCSATGSGNDGSGGAAAQGNTGTGNNGWGGFGDYDAGHQDADEDSGICSAISAEATPAMQPADIIMAVDTSGSMGEESKMVRDQLNAFSQQIMASGIDVRVIMIAEEPDMPWPFPPHGCMGFICEGVCIDPPLGSGSCPDDENPPHYFHIKLTDPADEVICGCDVGDWWDVYSTDGLNIIYHSYNDWGPLLRDGATKSFVIITDDDASQLPYGPYGGGGGAGTGDPDLFISDVTALDPVMLAEWKMHGIYCFTECPPAASEGVTWRYVIEQTGGVHGDLCQQDFQPVFDELATAIIIGSGVLDCQWLIPPPPPGEELDPNKVNVKFTAGDGTEYIIYHVDSAADCDPVRGGWYYDDNDNPTTIILCPASCDLVQADPEGRIDILFGCATEPLPPE